jgi:hypothetical protein
MQPKERGGLMFATMLFSATFQRKIVSNRPLASAFRKQAPQQELRT